MTENFVEIGHIEAARSYQAKMFMKTYVHECQFEFPLLPLFNPKTPHVLSSPLFTCGEPGCAQSSWRIQASIDSWQQKGRLRTIGLYLWRLHPKELYNQKELHRHQEESINPLRNDVSIKYKFELLDPEGIAQFVRESDIKEISQGAAVGGRSFASYNEVVRKKCLDSQRRMIVRVTITMYHVMNGVENLSDQDQSEQSNCRKKIKIMLGETLIGEFSAYHLARGGSLLKWIKDSKGNFLNVVDLEPAIFPGRQIVEVNPQPALLKAVHELCNFLETGKCESLDDAGVLRCKIRLYQLAGMFEMQDLQQRCLNSIIKHNLNLSECLKIARFMDKTKILDDPIKAEHVNALKEFVRRNIEELQKTDDFVNSFDDYRVLYTRLCLEPDLKDDDISGNEFA